MGTAPDPPLVADVLSYILIACLLYLFYYSFQLRRLLAERKKGPVLPLNEKVKPTQPKPRPKLTQFFIEPPPIAGKQIPYPTIAEIGVELDLSVVIPVRNPGKGITQILARFVEHLSKRQNFKYEIILVDICSRDTTRADCVRFAEQHKEVRVLHVPRRCLMTVAVLAGIMRTRGRLVYLYNVSDGVRIDEYDAFEAKAKRYLDQRVLVCGTWRQQEEDVFALRSTLSIFLEWLTQWLLGWVVKPRQCDHAMTFLMTRNFVAIAGVTMQIETERFDLEMMVIAGRTNTEIKTVRLMGADPRKCRRSTLDRVDDFIVAVQSLFMYYTGLWKVKVCRTV